MRYMATVQNVSQLIISLLPSTPAHKQLTQLQYLRMDIP